jgi:Fungal N-terminal domain of STAND proteins
MEAVSAGAGVLAFIAIALRSTKTIYETASIIRNGPAEIEHLASAVYRLQSVLTQLSKLPDVGLADSELDLERYNLFSILLKTCNKDVSRFEQEFKKVQTTPEDKKAGIAWKKIKTILKETEFHRIRDVVNNHVTELGVQLSMIQS